MSRPSQYRGLWLTLALAFCCRHGAAEPAPGSYLARLAFQYDADPSLQCPSETEIKASIVRQLGYDPFSTAATEQRLRVNVTKVANRAEARIEWIDSHDQSEGERRLASDESDCSVLARSLVFAVAVQIQLHASANEPPPSEPTAPAPPPPPPTPPLAASRDKPPPRVERKLAQRRIFLGLGTLLRHGMTPGLTPGLRAFGGLASERWSLELSAHGTLAGELGQADGTGFTANELGANLVPCLRFSPVGACAVGTLSVLRVRGHGVDRIGTPSALTLGVGARLQLIWPALERFGVILQAEALALPARQDVLLNRTVVWSTAPVVFAAILDFAAIFP